MLCQRFSVCVENLMDRKCCLFKKNIQTECLYFFLSLKHIVRLSERCLPYFWEKEEKLMLHDEHNGRTF